LMSEVDGSFVYLKMLILNLVHLALLVLIFLESFGY